MYTGFKYMEHEVVVVEVQYRLHALGKFDKIKIKPFQCSKNETNFQDFCAWTLRKFPAMQAFTIKLKA